MATHHVSIFQATVSLTYCKGAEEEEMSLLAAVSDGDHKKRASFAESNPDTPTGTSLIVGDEEEAVSLLDASLVAVDGAAVGPHTASSSGAELVVEQAAPTHSLAQAPAADRECL